jgi:hypothetical protein
MRKDGDGVIMPLVEMICFAGMRCTEEIRSGIWDLEWIAIAMNPGCTGVDGVTRLYYNPTTLELLILLLFPISCHRA